MKKIDAPKYICSAAGECKDIICSARLPHERHFICCIAKTIHCKIIGRKVRCVKVKGKK